MDTKSLYLGFGRKLQKLRLERRMTQARLAEEMKLSRASITNIESGNQKILLHHLYLFADALKVAPLDLLPDLAVTVRQPPIEELLPKDLSLPERFFILKKALRSQNDTDE